MIPPTGPVDSSFMRLVPSNAARRRVLAVRLAEEIPKVSISRLLIAHDVRFAQSVSPPLSPLQSPAARASTLPVGVLCG